MLYGCVTSSLRTCNYNTLRRAHHSPLARCIGWRKNNRAVEFDPNRVMSKMALDRGGHFTAAGVFGLHTLSLVLSSQAAHDRASVDSQTHNITHDRSRLTLKRRHST